MGVPKFIGPWLFERLRRKKIRNVSFDRLPKNVASLLLDMNGLVYKAREIVYGMGEDNLSKYSIYFSMMSEEDKLRFTAEVLVGLIEDIVLTVAPYATVVISVDGPTNRAKIQQQRARRYNSAASEHKNDPDSCAITPGTPFMIFLNEYLNRWLVEFRHIFPLNLIYSSHLDPGEGEHKIMKYFRRGVIKEEGAHLIYGLDADFLILSSLLDTKNVYLVREDFESIISIDGFKEMLTSEAPYNLKKSAVHDFCALASLVGNDFIPHGPTHDSMFNIVETMLNTYHHMKTPVTRPGVGDVRYIDFKAMAPIVNKMALTQSRAMAEEASHRRKFPDSYYPSIYDMEAIKEKTNVIGEEYEVYDWKAFRSIWYSREFARASKGIPGLPDIIHVTEDNIANMCNSFMEGMSWIYRYYQTDTVSPYWYYPYHRAPLYTDLALIMNKSPKDFGRSLNAQFIYADPLPWGALEQLLMVIPYSHAHNLPHYFRGIYSEFGPYCDLFPRSFVVEMDGILKATPAKKGEEHLANVIVPDFDLEKVLTITQDMGIVKGVYDRQPVKLLNTTETKLDRYSAASTDTRALYEKEMNHRDYLRRKERREREDKIKNLSERKGDNTRKFQAGILKNVGTKSDYKEARTEYKDIKKGMIKKGRGRGTSTRGGTRGRGSYEGRGSGTRGRGRSGARGTGTRGGRGSYEGRGSGTRGRGSYEGRGRSGGKTRGTIVDSSSSRWTSRSSIQGSSSELPQSKFGPRPDFGKGPQ